MALGMGGGRGVLITIGSIVSSSLHFINVYIPLAYQSAIINYFDLRLTEVKCDPKKTTHFSLYFL